MERGRDLSSKSIFSKVLAFSALIYAKKKISIGGNKDKILNRWGYENIVIAQSAGAVEYTDYTSAEG